MQPHPDEIERADDIERTDDIERADEYLFASDVSDEALEASGGGALQILFSLSQPNLLSCAITCCGIGVQWPAPDFSRSSDAVL
jgi:hypothetical protein